MYNITTYSQASLSLSFLFTTLCHGKSFIAQMFKFYDLYHVLISISFFFLLLHALIIFFIKILILIFIKEDSGGEEEETEEAENRCPYISKYKFVSATTVEDCYEIKQDLVANFLGGNNHFFTYKDDTILVDEVKDSKEDVSFEEEESIIASESAYYSPQEDLTHVSDSKNDATDSQDVTSDENEPTEEKVPSIIEENKESSSEDERLISVKKFNFHPRCEKIQLEEVPEDGENYGGSLTGESTSKSSVEWRTSTIFRDSETEYPFSSSSRRSSSRWESYTVFPKYNEGMVFLDRVSAQKLSETESLRSIKVHPRSFSERIVHKLSTKPRSYARRNPYEELEIAYVAQICLAWEALNWNYTNFMQKNGKNVKKDEGSGCPAHIAQQFQQFQVLLQRFIENEPYEYGRRPEIYARRRISSPKLLQVPEFREMEADKGNEDMNSKISSSEFLLILDDAIQTFMKFLKADKEKCGDIFKAFMKRRSSSVNVTFLRFLKKANRRKKVKLKDIGRRHRCIRKRNLTEEEEMQILMGLIDLKLVSRVLRMSDISIDQLHWCEEKMGRVRVFDGKLQRDTSPLFFPVH